MNTATELLRAKAREYDARSAHEAELDEHRREQAGGEFVLGSSMPIVWATVAVVLFEVAEALEAAA